MQTRKLAVVISIALSFGIAPGPTPAAMAAQTVESSSPIIDEAYTKLHAFLLEHYERIKITKKGNKIHFEYKVRPFTASGQRTEMAPDFGGVMGDVELKTGQYSGRVRLPQQYNEYNFYSVILMAPYSSATNTHLYTKLLYPSDTPEEFTERFKELMNEFGDNAKAAKPATAETASKSTGSQPTSAPASSETEKLFPRTELAGNDQGIFLWEAKRGNDIVYLLGTIPFVEDGSQHFVVGPGAQAGLSDATVVLVDSIDLHKSLPYSDKRIRYDSGDELSKHLSATSRSALDSYLQWSGETLNMYEFWKPWLLADSFDTSLFRSNGFKRIDWDKQLLLEAKKASKKITEVEDADWHTKFFEGLPVETQNKLLEYSIHDVMAYERNQTEASKAWLKGDLANFQDVSSRVVGNHPELKDAVDKITEERTNAMSAKIDENLKTGARVFVAMDSRRMLGDKGLLARLEKNGFVVQQTTNNALPAAIKLRRKLMPTATFGGARLSRYRYPEGKFSILLPGEPTMRYSNKTGMRQVEYLYQDTQGAYCIGYIMLPSEPASSAIPHAFDATMKGLCASYNAEVFQQTAGTLQGHPGRIINITKIKGKDDWGVHVRMYVIGKMLYILAAEGTTAWLRSPAVHQVSNSLTVTTDSDPN